MSASRGTGWLLLLLGLCAAPVPVRAQEGPAQAGPAQVGSAQAGATAAKKDAPLICLLPLGKHDRRYLGKGVTGLKHGYGFPVRVLEKRSLPESAYYAPRKRYRADRILDWIDAEIVSGSGCKVVIGFTSLDISTTKGKHHDWGIFGLGRLGGTSAVVSTFRLGRKTRDWKLVARRTIKVLNHELGHALGLPHCPTPGCLMNDAEGSIRTVDNEKGRLCDGCRKLLEATLGVAIPTTALDWDEILKDTE